MSTLKRVTNEIVDLHDFFTHWFNGTVDRDQLEPRFLSHLDPNVVFVSPDGHILSRDMMREGFTARYGSNKAFRIKVRDVAVHREFGDLIMATYTEWQVGAVRSSERNARLTSVLLRMSDPVTWLHIHETWLPDTVRDAGSFDF